jgi:hypothetical protein
MYENTGKNWRLGCYCLLLVKYSPASDPHKMTVAELDAMMATLEHCPRVGIDRWT